MSAQKNNRTWSDFLPFFFIFSDNLFEKELREKLSENGFKSDAQKIKSDFSRALENLDPKSKRINA